jgi:hypothetical protein
MKAQIDMEYPLFIRIKKKRREYEAPEHSARPTRNRFFCNAIGRTKMLFKTKVEADRFIAYNSGSYENQSYVPCRAYKCCCCDGWHITHYAQIPRRKEDLERRVIANSILMRRGRNLTPAVAYAY